MKTSKGSAQPIKPFKLCVCGGRDFDDEKFLFAKLDHLTSKINRPIVVITGGAKGADYLAGQWAYHARHTVINYHADWKKYGKSAECKQSEEILESMPDVVVCFGKSILEEKAKILGLPVRRYL